MAGQMEGLLKEIGVQLGSVLQSTSELKHGQEALREEHSEIRERIKALEVSAIVSGQYGTKEHDALLKRLAEGDQLFDAIKRDARRALDDADSARVKIKELQEQLQKQTEKRGKTRWDVFKILIECGLGALGFLLAKGIELMLRTRSP